MSKISVREFLENVAPYQRAKIDFESSDNWPLAIELYCSKYGKRTGWNKSNACLTFAARPVVDLGKCLGDAATEVLAYSCVFCETMARFMVEAEHDDDYENFSLIKFGQQPEPYSGTDRAIEKRLRSNERLLYRRAVKSTQLGYGIGAIGYLRCLVERTTKLILDRLRAAAKLDQDEALVKRIDEALAKQTADERMKAASLGIPGWLMKAGSNPLTFLWKFLSEPLHIAEEAPALEKAEEILQFFEIVMRSIHDHMADAEAVKELMNKANS